MMQWLGAGIGPTLKPAIIYQLFTYLLMTMIVAPVHGLAAGWLASSQGAITNATLVPFLLSWRGAVLVLITVAMLAVAVTVEILGLVAVISRARRGEPEAGYRSTLRFAFGRLRNLATPWGLVLALALTLVAPLSGMGLTLSVLRRLKIPTFILDHILSSPWLASALVVGASLLAVMGFGLVLTPALIVLNDLPAGRAMWTSLRLARRHLRTLLAGVVGRVALANVVVALVALLWWGVVLGLMLLIGAEHPATRVLFSGLLLVQYLAVALLALVKLPYQVNAVVSTFEMIAARDELAENATIPQVLPAHRRGWADRALDHRKTITAVGVVLLALASVVVGLNLEKFIRPERKPEIVAHRAGGFAAPENSLSGLNHAIKTGADWVEVDVQRTRDGHYILNHDDTFTRAARDKRASRDMTLTEVKQLNIARHGTPPERVPDVEEFLRAARGKIKVILELKGSTADVAMAEDLVRLVKQLGMVDQVMIMALDYKLVIHTETAHPEMTTGFVYFFSFGKAHRLVGDYLILEQDQASEAVLSTIELAGKKTMVWTVNDPEGMQRFANGRAQAVITDEPTDFKAAAARAGERTTFDLFLDMFLGMTSSR